MPTQQSPNHENINALVLELLERFTTYLRYPGVKATEALTRTMERYEEAMLKGE